jgi:hypothetical protein
VDRTVGLDDVRADIAMMRTPDGHGRVELTKFHQARPTTQGDHEMTLQRMDNVLIVVEDLDAAKAFFAELGSVAMRASSSDWPSSSADGARS